MLSSSPRRNGNSAILAEAACQGLQEAGHDAKLVFANDFLGAFLRDCRQCRKPDGECAIDDGFRSVFLNDYLPAQGFIAATPIYWYGTSAQLKAFFDRSFCYYAASYPNSQSIIAGMSRKRIGLLMTSEETFPMVTGSVISQMQEYCRYTHATFVGAVHGVGNRRGDVLSDPSDPVAAARRLGRELFTRHATDYQIDTPRAGKVWG